MLASLASLLRRSLRAIACRLPSKNQKLAWRTAGGISFAVWTASDEDTPNIGAGGVPCVDLEIRPNDSSRLPYQLKVSPAGYMPASFFVGDLETAHALALQQLAFARRLPVVGRAEPEGSPDARVSTDAEIAVADTRCPAPDATEAVVPPPAERLGEAA